jgi:nitroreductase
MTTQAATPQTSRTPAATLPLSAPAAIEARRSVRRYQPIAVPDADLEQILTLAGKAPSAFNVQPWRFVVVREPALKERLQAAAYNQAQVGAAPVLIVLYSDMADVLANLDEIVHPGLPADRREPTKQMVAGVFAGKTEAEREAWGAQQSAIALGYLTIAAQSLGYSTSVMGGFDPEAVKQLLGLPGHVAIPALVAMGVADEEGFPTHRQPLSRLMREAKTASN